MARLSKPLKIALFGLIGLNAALILWVAVISPLMAANAELALGQGDYRLDVTDGSEFTAASLAGRPSAVFFGFTHCPDVCPTTLGDVTGWQEALGGETELRVFFVTIDPERDTLDILKDYVGWAPGVTGVTGRVEDVQKVVQSFNIYAEKVPTDDGDYTMDHSASVLLFDDAGRFVETIRYQEDHDVAVGKIKSLMGIEQAS